MTRPVMPPSAGLSQASLVQAYAGGVMFKKLITSRLFQIVMSFVFGMSVAISLMIWIFRPYYLGHMQGFFVQQDADQLVTYVGINSTPEKFRVCKWFKISENYARSLDREIAEIETKFDLSRDVLLSMTIDGGKRALMEYRDFLSKKGAPECP